MRHVLFIFSLYALMGSLSVVQAESRQRHTKALKLMGSGFELSAVSADSLLAWQAIEAGIAEIVRIEKLISSWDPQSQTSAINRQAGVQPVPVERELFELIRRSIKVSKLTQGAFDITNASMDRVWRYDGSMKALPTPAELAASVAAIGYEGMVLNEAELTVFLEKPGMKIGFGGMGKGYAANRAKAIMVEMGIANGVVNAGGDLMAWGRQADGRVWGVGIANPLDKNALFSWLNISDQAVVTSGNYEKFVDINGTRYGHIIHPKTGMPVAGTRSVTIICPDAELADALATAVFILGEQEGMALVDGLNGVECLLINANNEIITSKNLALNYLAAGSMPTERNY